jgi:hypothetical protein
MSVMLGIGDAAYLLVDIPAAVHAALLRLVASLSDPEVPVHVFSLLLPALLIGLESSSTLITRRPKLLIKL